MYFKKRATGFLQSLLKGALVSLSERSTALEVDPLRADASVNIEENRRLLIGVVQALLDEIFNSVQTFPSSLKMVLQELQFMVKERFPEMEYEIVGGFFFLRFLCPAIVAPESYGILIGTPRLG
mgnify:FL=1